MRALEVSSGTSGVRQQRPLTLGQMLIECGEEHGVRSMLRHHPDDIYEVSLAEYLQRPGVGLPAHVVRLEQLAADLNDRGLFLAHVFEGCVPADGVDHR